VPVHPWPAGYHHRITFPDATGTVITTGNTDDLVLKTVHLVLKPWRAPARARADGPFGTACR
jgi:hypothetical protein